MRIFIGIASFLFLDILFAQVNYSGSIVSNFGKSQNSFNFFENRMNINSDWRNWTAWLEFEHSNPPELGRQNIGLRKIRLEYQSDSYALKIGDIYEYWGNGLIFNMLDDQAIDLDTGVKGALLSYSNDLVGVEYLYGKQRSWRSTIHAPDFNERIPNHRTDYELNGLKASFNPSSSSYDFYLLNVNNTHSLPFLYSSSGNNSSKMINSLFYGHSFNQQWGSFESDYHYAVEIKNKGSAHNFNSYVFLNKYSFSFSLKDYFFNKLSPYDRWDFVNNPEGALFFQQMPTVFKTHSSLYLGRITHQTDYNDEVGSSITIEKQNASNGSFIFNYSQSSRHTEWENIQNEDLTTEWSVKNHTKFPSSRWQYNPFREVYLEINGYYRSKLFYQISWADTYDITDIFSSIYTNQGHAFSYEAVEAKTIPVILSYELDSKNSINAQFEYQSLKKGIYSFNPQISDANLSYGSSFSKSTQTNSFISLGFSRSPKLSISLNVDNTNTEDILVMERGRNNNLIENILNPIVDKSLTWANIDIVFNAFNSTQISLTYGSQRGGVFCSNGICRYVQSFENGFKFGITSAF